MARVEVNEIDYDRLATLSERSGQDFEDLCMRAELGARTDEELLTAGRRLPDDDWLTMQQTAEVFGLSYDTLCSILSKNRKRAKLEYFGLTWKSRSLVTSVGKRGCGVLFYRPDVDELLQVMQAADLMITPALRVFQASRLRLLPCCKIPGGGHRREM